MRALLFSCHHLLPELTCNTEIFQTLVSNLPEPTDGSFISDLGGINIATDNLYSELRHQFYVWKNLIGSYDYVGFEHYRRHFFIDTLPVDQLVANYRDVGEMRLYFAAFNAVGIRRKPHIFEQYLAMRRSLVTTAITRLKAWLGSYDIIVPRPNIQNIERQWKSWFHDDIYWDTMVEGIIRSGLFSGRVNYLCFQLETCYFANMYIMRTDLLDEYLTFCFEVLEFCKTRLPLRERALGYFSERLFSFWLYQKRIEDPTLRVAELPFVMLSSVLDSGTPNEAEKRAA
jgi:hypothetical protein